MRRWRHQRMTAIIGILAIAALLCTAVGPRLIAAQEATPDAAQAQIATSPEVDGATDTTTPSEPENASETPPATDDETTDNGDTSEENPAPSEEPAPSVEPAPSAQPVPPPAEGTSDEGEGDQPSPSPAVAPSPSPSPSPPPPSPTARVWKNHDTLTAAGTDPASDAALQPGATAAFQFVYSVTTPRTETDIHAEIRPVSGDTSGWQVRLSSLDGAGDDWSAAGPTADAIESATTQPDTTFTLTIAIRAPTDVPSPAAVALFISSTTATPAGSTESGLAGDTPLAQLQVVPPPSPSPSASPRPSPIAATPVALGTPAAAPTTSANACLANEETLPEVTANSSGFASPVWNGTAYTPVTATIEVTLSLPTADACLAPAWSIGLSSSAMTIDGDSAQSADAITYQGVSGLTAPGLSDAGLAQGTALDSAPTIVTGTHQTLNATHPSTTFQITVTWSPPADTPAGQYSSTISVKSVADAAP